MTRFETLAARRGLSAEARASVLATLSDLGLSADSPEVCVAYFMGCIADVGARAPADIRQAGAEVMSSAPAAITAAGKGAAEQVLGWGRAAVREMADQVAAVREASEAVRAAAKADVSATVAAAVADFISTASTEIVKTDRRKWLAVATSAMAAAVVSAGFAGYWLGLGAAREVAAANLRTEVLRLSGGTAAGSAAAQMAAEWAIRHQPFARALMVMADGQVEQLLMIAEQSAGSREAGAPWPCLTRTTATNKWTWGKHNDPLIICSVAINNPQ